MLTNGSTIMKLKDFEFEFIVYCLRDRTKRIQTNLLEDLMNILMQSERIDVIQKAFSIPFSL